MKLTPASNSTVVLSFTGGLKAYFDILSPEPHQISVLLQTELLLVH